MSSIPDEVYYEVLLRVPARSTFVCKCVSKTWLTIISNPNFIKKHLNLSIQRNKPNLMLKGNDENKIGNREVIYSIAHDSLKSLSSREKFLDYALQMDYPFNSTECSVDLLGCCHGLVCLWIDFGDRVLLSLWNPATKEYKQVPKSPDDNDMNEVSMVAFGYDSKNDDYKVLTRYDNLVQVYSLGLNSWKRIGNVEFRTTREAGVLVNGDLHWLAEARDSNHVVVSLDMSEERFKEMQLLEDPCKRRLRRFMTLGVLEGCLCVLVNVAGGRAEVWVMQEYGVCESWTVRYVIHHARIVSDYLLRLVWSFKSGEILFGTSSNHALVLYDPKCQRAKRPNIRRVPHLYQEGSYIESIVPLNSNTYEGRTRGINGNMKKDNRSIPKNRGG